MDTHIVLLAGLLLATVSATPIDNGIRGDIEVECDAEKISANFNTNKPWEGNLYVDNHFNDTACKVTGTGGNLAALSVPFDKCGVKRERSVSVGRVANCTLCTVESSRCVRMGECGHVIPSILPHQDRSRCACTVLLHGGRQDSQHRHRSEWADHVAANPQRAHAHVQVGQ